MRPFEKRMAARLQPQFLPALPHRLQPGERLPPAKDLAAVIGVIVWAFWPLSEEQLYQRAAAATASSDPSDWDRAAEYLDALDRDHPNHPHQAEEADLRQRLAEHDAAQGEVRIRVADTGVGIAPADQRRIFDKFQQVGDTLTEKPKGTGLGLAISRDIVEHHGGRVWVESYPGVGSTFTVALPVPSRVAVEQAA